MDFSRNMKSPSERRGDEGAGLVEYVLLIMLLAVVCIAGVKALGTHLSESFSESTSRIDTEMRNR